jgi:hypothetical protein
LMLLSQHYLKSDNCWREYLFMDASRTSFVICVIGDAPMDTWQLTLIEQDRLQMIMTGRILVDFTTLDVAGFSSRIPLLVTAIISSWEQGASARARRRPTGA